jgi:hypothetical protein
MFVCVNNKSKKCTAFWVNKYEKILRQLKYLFAYLHMSGTKLAAPRVHRNGQNCKLESI